MKDQMQEDMEEIAIHTIRKVLKEGAQKPRPCHWINESQNMHIDKAMRHACTYRLMRDNQQTKDGESHLELAFTRMLMALTQEYARK